MCLTWIIQSSISSADTVTSDHCSYKSASIHVRDKMAPSVIMIMSWYGNAFDITGPLWGESIGGLCRFVFDFNINKLLNRHSSCRWPGTQWRLCGVPLMWLTSCMNRIYLGNMLQFLLSFVLRDTSIHYIWTHTFQYHICLNSPLT